MGTLAGFSFSIRGLRDEGSMKTDPNLDARYGSGHLEQDRLTCAQLRWIIGQRLIAHGPTRCSQCGDAEPYAPRSIYKYTTDMRGLYMGVPMIERPPARLS